MSAAADKTPGGAPSAAPAKAGAPAEAACETAKRRMPLVLVVSGSLLILALAVAGWQSSLPQPAPVARAVGQPIAPILRKAALVCTLDAHASRNMSPNSASMVMTFDRSRLCANGHTPYEESAEGYSRTLFLGSGRTLSVLRLSRDMSHLERRDYFLDATEFARLRKARGRVRPPVCSREVSGLNPAVAQAVRSSADLARPFTSGTPDRLMAWSCSAQAVGPGMGGR
jgi:hypothetical protein